MALLAFIIMLGIAIFWVFEFVEFMRMKEEAFPNAHDRYIWAAAFLLAFPAAPFAFFIWQMMYEPTSEVPINKDNKVEDSVDESD